MADKRLQQSDRRSQIVVDGPITDGPQRSGKKIHSLEYCLYCYAPLTTTSGASQRCPHCGRVHLRADHASRWTREPLLVRIEQSIKLLIAGLICGWLVYLNNTIHLGRLSTFLIGPLLMLGGVLWCTAGLITRKSRYFSGRVLWCSSILLLVVGLPLLLFVMDVVARRQSFNAEYWSTYLVLASPALPLILFAIALHFGARRFEAFKARRLASWDR